MTLPFLNPALLIGLPLVAVPVIIHLLNRHKSVRIEWGAMELLRRVMVFRSRQVRLEDLLLMGLRCLVVLLVVLAAARPTTRWLSVLRRPDTGVLVAVDASMSMEHRPGLASRWQEAMALVDQIGQSVEPGRPLTLVTMASRPHLLLGNASHEPARLAELLAGPQARPRLEPLSLETCLPELVDLARQLKAPRREVFLVTDGQIGSFERLSPRAAAALKELAAMAQVYAVIVPPAGEENLSVSDLRLRWGMLRTGAIARFSATVRNHGRWRRDAGDLSLLLNDRVVDKRFVGSLRPGEATAVHFHVPLESVGTVRMVASLGGDALAADDRCHAVVHVRRAVRVLCVDGESAESAGASSSAAGLVSAALSPSRLGVTDARGARDARDARSEVDLVPWTAMDTGRLADYDVVVLVGVPALPPQHALALRKFTEQGGGVVVFPAQSPGEGSVEQLPVASGQLPVQMTGNWPLATDNSSGNWQLDMEFLSASAHPLAEALRSLPRDLLGEVRVGRVMVGQVPADARTVLRLANGHPLLLEQALGRGKLMTWTSGPDRPWSNLAIHPAFPVLMQETVTRLCRRPAEEPVIVPQPIVVPLAGDYGRGTQVAVNGPAGSHAPAQAAVHGGQAMLQTTATTAAGFWDLMANGDEGPITVAANVDTAESDVRVLEPAELGRILGSEVRVLKGDRNGAIAAEIQAGRTGRELWQGLLVAAILLFAAEWFLARWYSRRGG